MKYDWTGYLKPDEAHEVAMLDDDIKATKHSLGEIYAARDRIRRTCVDRARYAATKAALSIRKEET